MNFSAVTIVLARVEHPHENMKRQLLQHIRIFTCNQKAFSDTSLYAFLTMTKICRVAFLSLQWPSEAGLAPSEVSTGPKCS